MLVAGDVTNIGLRPMHEIEFDDCFSLDENLSYFIEMIEEGENAALQLN